MYRKTVLDNGVRIISERLEHFRSVSLGIWVDAGSRDESGMENGVSHLIEHMVFKGTRRRNSLQIAKQLDAIGGLSNAFTGKEQTCFHSKVLAKDFPVLADILADIFLNSLFDSQDLDKERQVILQEINMVEDTPDDHIHVLFNRRFWADHPFGMPVLGTSGSVAGITKETILGYIQRFYTPNRIVIAAAGHVDHDSVVGTFRPLFEALEARDGGPPRNTPPTHVGVFCNPRDLEQVHLCLGGKAPHLRSELRFAGAVLNAILGGNMSSRLFQEIREKRGLAYSVYSFFSPYIDTGLMGVYVGTDPAEVNRVLEVVNRELGKILGGELSRSDLEAAKEHLVGGILLGEESMDTRMSRLAKNEYVFGRYLSYEELVSDLESVTLDEVVSVARESFQGGEVALVTLGPLREEDLDQGHLHFA